MSRRRAQHSDGAELWRRAPLRRLLIYPSVYSFDHVGSHLPRGRNG